MKLRAILVDAARWRAGCSALDSCRADCLLPQADCATLLVAHTCETCIYLLNAEAQRRRVFVENTLFSVPGLHFFFVSFRSFSLFSVTLRPETKERRWIMTYINAFHKEVTERKRRKIAASQQSPMNSSDFAQYMKHNLELASRM